ncbi:MAG: lipoprotein [Dongiaceae bacterium]
MRKTILPILAILLLAACSSSSNYGGGGSGYGGAGSGSVNTPYATDAHFLANDPTVIELKVRDPLPVARVVLVDPTGKETAAYDIQRDKQVYRSDGGPRPSVGVGVAGGSSGHIGTGIGIGIPLFSSGQSNYTSTVVDSTAKVKIGNPVLYRESWQHWVLRAELDDGQNKRTIEMVPPKPL